MTLAPPDPPIIPEKEVDESPRIGARMKHLRLARRLRLKDLASTAGCSESLLSRIENNLVNPSLGTLHRLCRALGVNVTAVLADDGPTGCIVYRKGERPMLGRADYPSGERSETLVPYADGRLLEGFIMMLYPGSEPSGPYQHDGEEVGLLLEGELELVVDGAIYRLSAGDSFFFRSDLIHSYRNPGGQPTRVVWINTPPTF